MGRKREPALASGEGQATLFVRNVPYSAEEAAVVGFFSAIGPVKHATLVTDPQTKISRGYAFVTYALAQDAARATKELKPKLFMERKLVMELAQKRDREVQGVKRKQDFDAHDKSTAKKARPLKKKARLIVRNLPWSIRDVDELKAHFTKYGSIKEATLPRGQNGRMTGFGFVEMGTVKEAAVAIDKVNATDLDGRTIAVDWAVAKHAYEPEKEVGPQPRALSEDPSANGGESGEESDYTGESDGEGDNGLEDEESEEEGEEEDTDYMEKELPMTTLFVRNLPFTATDQDLYSLFRGFGPLQYARIVYDHATARSRGTGFVSFVKSEDAKRCVSEAPKSTFGIEDDRYVIHDRTVGVVQALNREEAETKHHQGEKERRRGDARNMDLLYEEGTKMGGDAATGDAVLRKKSLAQRKVLLHSNPSLHLSLTRLAIRNISRSVDEKALKQFARQAIVEFAKEVKAGQRQALTSEERNRSQGSERGGNVKQAKVVLEKDGRRSRGYGFVEYASHRLALMGLRWMSGRNLEGKKLVVEFAIENVTVVKRRRERQESQNSKWKAERQETASTASTSAKKEKMPRKDSAEAGKQRLIGMKRRKRKSAVS